MQNNPPIQNNKSIYLTVMYGKYSTWSGVSRQMQQSVVPHAVFVTPRIVFSACMYITHDGALTYTYKLICMHDQYNGACMVYL